MPLVTQGQQIDFRTAAASGEAANRTYHGKIRYVGPAVRRQSRDAVVEAVARTANTGKIGDGKVFVLDLEQALRIHTGDKDAAAIAGS